MQQKPKQNTNNIQWSGCTKNENLNHGKWTKKERKKEIQKPVEDSIPILWWVTFYWSGLHFGRTVDKGVNSIISLHAEHKGYLQPII